MNKPTIGLIGNPNCGKTTLFNALTGTNQRTGNWPGVTVDRKEGVYSYNGQEIAIVDLPGVYSLEAEEAETGVDELVARNYLLSEQAELIVNIVDASNLERNLYLSAQLMEMGLPLIVVLNMMDVATKRGMQVDAAALSQRLGCPVIPLVATQSQELSNLKAAIDEALTAKPAWHEIPYPAAVEEALQELVPWVTKHGRHRVVNPRWIALNLLAYDDQMTPELRSPDLTKLIVAHRRQIHQRLGEDLDIIIADHRYGFVQQVVHSVSQQQRKVSRTHSDQIDRVVLNRWLGIPIFFGVMYIMFLFTINFSSAFIDFFDILAGTIFVDGVRVVLANVNVPGWLIALLADGAGGGIQTVATFIPVIGFLFLFLSILEDSGYMARAAFVMDRLMRFVGLPGKSFVPMLVGFGCSVPAIMASRTLENSRDRILTTMMTPFMSCGARLPVYALFAAAFFPTGGQNVVFGLYLIGILAAIFTGLVLKQTLLRGESSAFIMELPPYHLPRLKGVLIRTWERLQAFISKGAKVIVLMVMVLGLLNSMGVDGSFGNQDSRNSVLSVASQTVTPVFSPMGISQDNWPATVGIFTGIFAKEAMVGTLDNLYTQIARAENPEVGEPQTSFDFWGRIKEAFASIPANLAEIPAALMDPLGLNIASSGITEQAVAGSTFGTMAQRFHGQAGAFAYLLFVLLYFPCIAATATIYRETNGGWTLFAVSWMTGLAYWVATLFYQVATWQLHPTSSLTWILVLALVMLATIQGLKLAGPMKRKQASI
jgi:ferrous iron transport protein B